jgi:hypothetical protein
VKVMSGRMGKTWSFREHVALPQRQGLLVVEHALNSRGLVPGGIGNFFLMLITS